MRGRRGLPFLPRIEAASPRGCGVRRSILLALLGACLSVGAPVLAQSTVSQTEALQLAFPGASRIERRTAYLTEAELAAVREAAGRGVEVRQTVVTYYVAFRGDQILGVAYFDAHRVRTMPEVLMIAVSPREQVQRIEVLRFSEPPEYRPPPRWLQVFNGKPLSPSLSPRRDIPNLSGATLTTNAVTEAVRRVLAMHRVIRPAARLASEGGG